MVPFLIFCSLTLVSLITFAETLNVVHFDYFGPAEPLRLTGLHFPIYREYDRRELIGLKVFIAPRTSSEDLRVELKINEEVISKNLPAYRPDDLETMKSVDFSFLPLLQQKVEKLEISSSGEAAVSHVQFVFSQNPPPDFEGDLHQPQIDRLGALSEQNLYEEHSSAAKDELTRRLAAEELSQYPSRRSAFILMDRMEYEGVRVDYELRRASQSSLKLVLDQLAAQFGEEPTVELMVELFDEMLEWQNRSLIIDLFAQLESSAGLLFLIDVHTYSPTSLGNTNGQSLNRLFDKPDFPAYLSRYKDRILREMFGPASDNSEWKQDRACEAFSRAPQPGLVRALYPLVREGSTADDSCLKALLASGEALDLGSEFSAFKKEMIEVITEPAQEYEVGGYKFKEFSWDIRMRRLSVLGLGELRTGEAREALERALAIDDLESTIREMILGVRWW